MNDHMIGYIALRRLIGIVGLLFPFILMIAYKIMNQGPLPGSISDYYYANEVCQSILVGSLCLIGGFLFTYRGYDKDYIPVRLASIFAIGVAFFPTIPNNPSSFNVLFTCDYLVIRVHKNRKPKIMEYDKTQKTAQYHLSDLWYNHAWSHGVNTGSNSYTIIKTATPDVLARNNRGILFLYFMAY
jgi:hypothetical protein